VSGHTPGDQLDLDAIEKRAHRLAYAANTQTQRIVGEKDVPALVAEVRRLRALVGSGDLVEDGRRLASWRDDLLAAGVDPGELEVPLARGDRP
jgi:hypothetical protein